MRHNVTHLAARLPSDIHKLCMLARLTEDELEQLLNLPDFEELDRQELADEIRLLRDEGTDDESVKDEVGADEEEESGERDVSKRPNPAMPVAPRRSSPPDEGLDAPVEEQRRDNLAATDKEGPDQEKKSRKVTAKHKKRCRQLEKFRREAYLTFEAGTPEDDFVEQEVQRIAVAARKTARRVLSKAMKAAGYDREVVAMALMSKLGECLTAKNLPDS